MKDYKILVDKYDIITDEKDESLGKEMKLKDLMDLWGNRINIFDKNDCYVGYCFKTIDREYVIDIMKKKFNDKNLLKTIVLVSKGYDEDTDGYPIVDCKIKG